jgi:hypothetical protein
MLFRVLGPWFFGLLSLSCTDDRTPSPTRDAGAAVSDGGVDAAPSDAAVDAGDVVLDAGPSCREELVPPFVGAAPCSMATKDCIDACADGDCVGGCLDADPSAACQQCHQRGLVGCINRNGCQAQWNCYRACIVEHCPVPSGMCIETNCLEPEDAWNDCADGEPLRVCGTSYEACLPE